MKKFLSICLVALCSISAMYAEGTITDSRTGVTCETSVSVQAISTDGFYHLKEWTIENGADDNASGVSAVLQIAKAFAQSNIVPERNVIFAFWDGEEIGLLGSKFFVQNCPFISQVKGYLNFDMIVGPSGLYRLHVPSHLRLNSHSILEGLKEEVFSDMLLLL